MNNTENKNKHKLIQYANGPSLEEINGTVKVPKERAFGEPCLPIQVPVRLSLSDIWIPAIGQRPLQAVKTFNIR